ncbi:class I SAM-dependent methyltransferase [Streptomyces sp. NPDC004647]|uniref:class I SAM-dependent methyltransferase n=1 Tax=Streptomyces sp. NPDC004647 TaxID=3154671 RepID=UPI00339E248A
MGQPQVPGSGEAHYARIAPQFNDHWMHSREYVAWMRRSIRDYLQPVEGEHALDLGCGTGIYTPALAPTRRPITVIDPSPAMLEQTLQLTAVGQAELLPVLASAQDVARGSARLPFPKFDMILAKEVMHHVPATDRMEVVTGLARLLSPGGRLLVTMLPTTISYPLWPEALSRFTQGQPQPSVIAATMRSAALHTELGYAHFPLRFSLDRWETMVRDRFMSLLSTFSAAEIERGLAEVAAQIPSGQVAFPDRFAFILGTQN